MVPDDVPPERHRAQAAYEAMIDLARGADVLAWSRTEFEARLPLRASSRAAVHEGMLLHDAR